MLRRIALVLQFLKNLGVDDFGKLTFPTRQLLIYDSRLGDADHDQELLVDVEHQVLQVGVDTRLRVNRGLLVR